MLTADTASLLLKSGPPFIVRSMSDACIAKRKRSEITKVCEANTSGTSETNSEKPDEEEIFQQAEPCVRTYTSNVSLDRSRTSIFSGGGGLRKSLDVREKCHSTDDSYREVTELIYQSLKHPNKYKNFREISLIQQRFRNSSLLTCKKFSSDNKTNSIAYAGPRQDERGKDEESAGSEGLRKQSNSPFPNSAVKSTHVNKSSSKQVFDHVMAGRQKSTQLVNKGEKHKPKAKTLTPSKHGFHPRSHSPTFKRLVNASERLSEMVAIGETTESSQSSSMYDDVTYKRSDYTYDRYNNSSSSDSVAGLLMYGQNLLDNFVDSDNTSDSSLTREPRDCDRSHRQRNSRTLGHISDSLSESEDVERLKKSHDHRKHHHHQPRKLTRLAPNRRLATSLERGNNSENRFEVENEESFEVGDNVYGQYREPAILINGSFHDQNSSQSVDSNRGSRNSHPMHLHFFLPQLADGNSEAQDSVTNRTFMQERLELLNRNDYKDTESNVNARNDNDRRNRSPLKTSTSKLTKARQTSRDRGIVREIRHGTSSLTNGKMSPPKAEICKSKRQVSPVRNYSKTEKMVPRRRPSYPREIPVYIESALPGEVLKKKMEDFPTLVSMDFSDAESPLQVR